MSKRDCNNCGLNFEVPTLNQVPTQCWDCAGSESRVYWQPREGAEAEMVARWKRRVKESATQRKTKEATIAEWAAKSNLADALAKPDTPEESEWAERTLSAAEADPNGKSPHEAGAKLDAGKNRCGLVLLGFARALQEVSKVGTYGANKYTDNGWVSVPDGENRYTDAMLRHLLREASGEECDPDTELSHAAHVCWNALARLDLMLRNREIENLKKSR